MGRNLERKGKAKFNEYRKSKFGQGLHVNCPQFKHAKHVCMVQCCHTFLMDYLFVVTLNMHDLCYDKSTSSCEALSPRPRNRSSNV